ncbi:uncharacterized protein LOC127242565 [Andrographis paniculata]|uniref:uncharacterized protein LOC127242565 n=1 Tax=Andrographis paniculata TaxID=175694 RepID=UPI0021E7BE59|nr:uncharacterized protein LOC127242565 [Andrographis paniculata]
MRPFPKPRAAISNCSATALIMRSLTSWSCRFLFRNHSRVKDVLGCCGSLSVQIKELSKLVKQNLSNKGKQTVNEATVTEKCAYVNQSRPQVAESSSEKTQNPTEDEVRQISIDENGPSQPRAIPATRVPEQNEKGLAQSVARVPFPIWFGKKDGSKDFDKFRAFPDEAAAVQLESVCIAVFKEDLPKKLSDPGSFIMIFTIGNLEPIRALCDLGTSINLIPSSLFSKLGLYELEAWRTVIQLADKSIRLPKGIIRDVLVQLALSVSQEENCDFIDELNELSTFENYMTLETLEEISDN